MIDLKELSTPELSLLCRKAGEECRSRFGEIAQAADPSDHALQDLLASMAKEANPQNGSLQDREDRTSHLSQEEILAILRNALPTLSKRFGEGVLHRDIALFYAESLEEEASRFYQMLSGHAHEWKTRDLFFDLSECERGKLRFLREVVLQG